MSPDQRAPDEVILATSNPGKVAELRDLLPSAFEVKSFRDLGLTGPEETGSTFAENAALKAVDISLRVDAIVVADDSGLEVDALGGAPGVFSARFSGEPPNDQRNIELLLEKLSGVPDETRSARFRCAIAVARHGTILLTADGVCEGAIGHGCRGSNGFGYDPVFVLPSGSTMAELSTEEKNRISHRAVAFRAVADAMIGLIEEQSRRGDAKDDSEGIP